MSESIAIEGPHEKRAVEKIRAMVAHGYGKLTVVVHDGHVDLIGGPSERIKIPVDKLPRRL